MRTPEHTRPDHVLAHLSDTHLRHPDDPLVGGVIDPRVPLSELLAGLLLSGHAPEALVVTGDLSDDATPHSYRELRALVDPIAEAIGAGVIWLNGNHDSRTVFRAEILAEPESGGPVNQVHWLGGLRVLCLDSTVPGEDYGRVAPESLDWLAAELADPAPEGTILAMHHAPLPVVQDLAAAWELLDQALLAEVVTGSDVRTILAGHFHQSSFGTFAGVPVAAATSTCQTQDLFTGRAMRGQASGQGFTLVHVHPDTIHHVVVPIGRGDTVIPLTTVEESHTRLARRGVVFPQ
ncbi:MAG: metallophosphoesterase [Propionicimonas sp.]|nr:metallophosphoesterase [Propionicimonas sp.]